MRPQLFKLFGAGAVLALAALSFVLVMSPVPARAEECPEGHACCQIGGCCEQDCGIGKIAECEGHNCDCYECGIFWCDLEDRNSCDPPEV